MRMKEIQKDHVPFFSSVLFTNSVFSFLIILSLTYHARRSYTMTVSNQNLKNHHWLILPNLRRKKKHSTLCLIKKDLVRYLFYHSTKYEYIFTINVCMWWIKNKERRKSQHGLFLPLRTLIFNHSIIYKSIKIDIKVQCTF